MVLACLIVLSICLQLYNPSLHVYVMFFLHILRCEHSCNLVQVLCHKTGNYKLFEIGKPNDQQYHAKCSFLGGDRIQTVQLLCILGLLRLP